MRRRPVRTALVALVGIVSLGLVAGSAAAGTSTPVPFPAAPKGLPAPGPMGTTLDAPAGYQPQGSCAVAPLPGTAQLRDLILRTYGRGYDGGAVRSCVVGSMSEHKEGRAWDWMLDFNSAADRAAAANFLGWLTQNDGAMASRLGVMYVIYNKRMWSTWSDGWKVYEGSDPHTSHVHISLGWNGARGHTSFWTGRTWALDYGTCQVFASSPSTVAAAKPRTIPCPAPVDPARTLGRPLLWMGSTGGDVSDAQRLLGSPTTGTFTSTTRRRVLRYQYHHDLPRTGAVDRATWAALTPGQATSLHPEWTVAEALAWTRDVAGSPTLRRGDAGRPVTALQAALGLPVAQRTGFFGRRTGRLVKQAAGREQDQVSRVDDAVWQLLG